MSFKLAASRCTTSRYTLQPQNHTQSLTLAHNIFKLAQQVSHKLLVVRHAIQPQLCGAASGLVLHPPDAINNRNSKM